jgi:site-specific DNA-methyltransferase (adenine-specific)
MAAPITSNTLFYGDNLDVLRKHFPLNDYFDLIYLDPPFNSKADYNVLFKEKSGKDSVAQVQAFTDFWHWDSVTQETFLEIQKDPT